MWEENYFISLISLFLLKQLKEQSSLVKTAFYCLCGYISCIQSTVAGKGTVDVAILDPHGHKDKVRAAISPVVGKDGTYLVEYTAIEPGLHSVNVFFSGTQIPGSPFGVNVAPGQSLTGLLLK